MLRTLRVASRAHTTGLIVAAALIAKEPRRYGFCGYLIVPGALRGQGQLRALVQRIEQEMRRLRPAV